MSRSETLGAALRASCSAIQTLVTAMHTGTVASLPAPITVRRSSLYFTPSFVGGQGMTEFNSQPYTVGWLSSLLGNRYTSGKANNVVRISLLLLELKELGEITDKDLEDVYAGVDNFTQEMLQEIINKTRDLHYQQEAEQILMQSAL